MSKLVTLSVQPKWCELIASGKKTIEVRKTKPKIDTPFKCYIYCTKDKIPFLLPKYSNGNITDSDIWLKENGKVIGEFMCDRITTLVHVGTMNNSELALVIKNSDRSFSQLTEKWISKTCLSLKELENYSKGGDLCAWHISNLKIYDKPKELSEFIGCNYPPQSWRYVEEEIK